ncbi:MAG: cytochrome c [Rhodobacteraceae bacterium]|nr:cytochrome c [Paracoccaceae bacterium]
MNYNRICLSAVALTATLAGPLTAQDATQGQELYVAYCATCHGADATGTGPMAELIAVETPDLTGLSARNGGVFPAVMVASQIDGRDLMLAHGGQMPLFGRFFEGDEAVALATPSGQPMMTSQPIADLLAWLESIQS